MKKILYAGIILSFFCSFSCGSPRVVVKSHPIPVLPPPKALDMKKPGVPETPDKIWLDPPVTLQPQQYWRAFKDGAICWRPRDWRQIKEQLEQFESWGGEIVRRLNEHNRIIESETR